MLAEELEHVVYNLRIVPPVHLHEDLSDVHTAAEPALVRAPFAALAVDLEEAVEVNPAG